MVRKFLRHVAGIDVAQKELVVSMGRMHEDLTTEVYAYKTFPNTGKGFATLVLWAQKCAGEGGLVRFVMEATGVYHEALAYYLEGSGLAVSIVLPNKISNYARSLDVKTVTDRTASEAIARFGLERKLEDWKHPKDIFKRMRQLCRERDQVVEERTVAKNQLHAEQSEAEPNKMSVKRIESRIALLDKQEKEIRGEVSQLVGSDEGIKQVVVLICSIPGIGLLTAAVILAETNGFDLIRNKRQLASYAGLDVKEKQSGTSVKGKPRISKQGNRNLRKAMHMPSLMAIRDERFKAIYARLVSKHGIKMKALVAIQRKLLEMVYTIYKTNTKYDSSYLQKQEEKKAAEKKAAEDKKAA